MTVIATETDERERIEAKVYTDDNGNDPRISVSHLGRPASNVCVLMCDLTELNLRQLKGYDDGISTSATVYDAIEEAVCQTKYRDRVPYKK